MSRSRGLVLVVWLAAGLLAACSDATGPRPNFSCETQGSNSARATSCKQ
jgi:hypothetical protein